MASWTDEQLQSVWEKGTVVPGKDKDVARKDACGAWILRSEYGTRTSSFGWEIDHIDPSGGDDLANLRPLQWKNNLAKSDGHLICAVTAMGGRNLEL